MSEEQSANAAPTAHVIGVEFFSKRGNKEELLINAKDLSAPIEGKSRWFNYQFARPVYLTQLEISTDGYASYDKFEIEVDHVDGTRHEEKIGIQSGVVSLRLAKLCNAFRFKPDKKFLSDPKLLRVVASGYSEDEFHQFELNIKNYQASIADLTKREARVVEQEDELAELKSQKVELESTVGKSRAEAEQLAKNVSAAKDQIQKQQERLTDAQSKFSVADEQLRNLQMAVEKEESKHRELVREVRLFPSEIAGFVKEGNRSIIWYSCLGLPFLVVLVIILVKLFSNAVDLTQIYKSNEEIEVWTIFITRIPFVLVAVALIEVCGVVVGRLIFEIVRINRQRIEFAKLSIIAKDVSTASAAGLEEMSESDVYDRETKLKMELLREHMKNFVGTEFEYKGTGLVAAIKGVADRIAPKKSQ